MKSLERALELSELAYDTRAAITTTIVGRGGEMLAFIDNTQTDTQGFIARLHGKIIVVFRGTEGFNVQDWVTNFKREMVYDGMTGGKLHLGFDQAFTSILNDMYNVLAECQLPICVYGHSLGGALATIAAYYLKKCCGFNVAHVGLIGSPKVGDALFAAQFNKLLFRRTHNYVNCCDIVTRVPFRNYPVGKLFYIDSNSVVHAPITRSNGRISAGSSKAYRTCDRVLGRFKHLFQLPSRGIDDHSLSSYEKALS